MHFLILLNFIGFSTKIAFFIPESENEKIRYIIDYTEKNLTEYLKNDWDVIIYKEKLKENIVKFAKENNFAYIFSFNFIQEPVLENNFQFIAIIRVFDAIGNRFEEIKSESKGYEDIELQSEEFLYSILPKINRLIPRVYKVEKVEKGLVYLKNSHSYDLYDGKWLKLYDEIEENIYIPVAYIQVTDILSHNFIAKIIYSEKTPDTECIAFNTSPPSPFFSFSLSPLFSIIFSDTGGYGNKKGLKPSSSFYPGFSISANYSGLSLIGTYGNIGILFGENLTIWNLSLGLTREFILIRNLLIGSSGGIGAYIPVQGTKRGISVTGLGFYVYPEFYIKLNLLKKFVLKLNFSYPFSQPVESFAYEIGTGYTFPDSLLNYKKIHLKGPLLKLEIGTYFEKPRL